jgi:hypothetical protein
MSTLPQTRYSSLHFKFAGDCGGVSSDLFQDCAISRHVQCSVQGACSEPAAERQRGNITSHLSATRFMAQSCFHAQTYSCTLAHEVKEAHKEL